MPTEVAQAVTAIQAALDQVPGALIVVVLLGGPTVIWILYRALTASAPQRFVESTTNLLWVCPACRSVNGIGASSCYRCAAVPDDDDLEIITPDPATPGTVAPLILPALDRGQRPLVAVGPGRQATDEAGAGTTRTAAMAASTTPAATLRAASAASAAKAARRSGADRPATRATPATVAATTPTAPRRIRTTVPSTPVVPPPAPAPVSATTPTPRRRRAAAASTAVAEPSTTVEPVADEVPEAAPVPVPARTRKGR